jgi:hypothetical protein
MSTATIIKTAFAASALALVLPAPTGAADTTINPAKLRYGTATREAKLKQGESLTWNGR